MTYGLRALCWAHNAERTQRRLHHRHCPRLDVGRDGQDPRRDRGKQQNLNSEWREADSARRAL